MPAPSTCNEFLDVVRDTGLLEEKRLDEFLEQYYAVSSLPEDPRILAEDLLKAGFITPFQKDHLLKGKRRGFVIADKYILLDHIGAGGMGSVYLCEHKVMRRKVAIKVLPPNFAKDSEYLQRFHREARAAAALDHPNIVRAHDVDQDGNMHFLVMEFIEGSSLHSIVSKEGPLDFQRAADYISQAASGLQHAHEAGLVHRDIKPGNLLVDRRGTVKILDMGLALFFQEKGESLTQQYDASAVLGTADYLAPEQVIDSHAVDIRADIYSLGLTFFFLLTGQSPYGEGTIAQKLIWHQMRPPKSVREFRPEVPDGLAAIINKMIAKDRKERYQTPAALVEALAPWVQGTASQEGAEPDAPAGLEIIGSAPTDMEMPGSTLNASSAPLSPPDGVRNAPGSSDSRSPRTIRAPRSEGVASKKLRAPKSGKLSTGQDSKGKTSNKKPSSSTRNRRPKDAPEEFWTKPRMIVAGSAAGVLVVLGLVLLIMALHRSSRTGTPTSQGSPGSSQVGVNTQQPSSQALPIVTKAEPPTTKVTPSPPTTKKVQTTKPESTKPETHTNVVIVPPTPEVKKVELKDYFPPKPGEIRVYDSATYSNGRASVTQQKWEFKDSGVIDVTTLKVGTLPPGSTLLGGGTVHWQPRAMQKKDTLFYRTMGDRMELGQNNPQAPGTVVYEPILPVLAALGDAGKWEVSKDVFRDYKIEKLAVVGGISTLTVRDSTPYPGAGGGTVVNVHTYEAGTGEVSWSQTFETNGTVTLTAERKPD